MLISERNQENEMVPRMQRRGIEVAKLMGNQSERDDRQMVFTPPGHSLRAVDAAEARFSGTFPNVPYEEHKGL